MTEYLESTTARQRNLASNKTEVGIKMQAAQTEQSREQRLKSWLEQSFAQYDIEVDSLPGDASFRRYHRLSLTPKDNGTRPTDTNIEPLRYIVMDAPPELESIVEFVTVDELMAPCINVPDIIAKDMEQGFLVLQDFGTTEFAHIIADGADDLIDSYYKRAIDTLLKLQTIPIDQAKQKAQLPDYDAAMLKREMALFSEWFIPYLGVRFGAAEQHLWEAFKEAIIGQIVTQPQVVVHRDYHSRNLMQDCANSEQLGVIDFQDAVIGAYSYDLVSLLRDAYVDWSEAQIADWIAYYWQRLQAANIAADISKVTEQQLTYDINIIGIQRHLKILGIFVRLSERDGKTRYLADIPKVMGDLVTELNWLCQQPKSSVTSSALAFKQWLDNDVMPAFSQVFKDNGSDS